MNRFMKIMAAVALLWSLRRGIDFPYITESSGHHRMPFTPILSSAGIRRPFGSQSLLRLVCLLDQYQPQNTMLTARECPHQTIVRVEKLENTGGSAGYRALNNISLPYNGNTAKHVGLRR